MPGPSVAITPNQLAGVVFGLAGARLRAVALERRLAGALRAAGLALAALAVGALRVAPAFFGAARFATGLRVEVLSPTAFLALVVLLLPIALPASSTHLPDSTRCAASATASAISDPSLEALVIIVVAAWLALSAASRPASRIALRALGLAAIAAAAAVKPAASISRLIAALAILSIVVFLEPLPLLLLLARPVDALAITASLLSHSA